TTTVAAYGKGLPLSLTPSQWAALPSIFVSVTNAVADGTNATYTYIPTTQFLHENESVTITGFSNPAFNVTAPIHNVLNKVAYISATSVSGGTLTVTTVSNTFAPDMTVNLAGLTNSTFLNGRAVIVLTASPTQFTATFAHAPYATLAEPITATAEVTSFQIPLAQVISLETQVGTNAGLVTPTLQSGYYLSGGNYALGTAPINTAGAGIGESWNPSSPVFQGQIVVDINGNTQLALNAGTTGPQSPTDLASPPNPWSAE